MYEIILHKIYGMMVLKTP